MIVIAVLAAACSGGGAGEEGETAPTRRPTTAQPTTTAEPTTTRDTLRRDLATMQPSDGWLTSFRTAAAMDPGSEFRDRLYLATAEACPTAEDWLVSLSRFPEAAGLREPGADAMLRELELICGFKSGAPLCVQAAQRRLIDGDV